MQRIEKYGAGGEKLARANGIIRSRPVFGRPIEVASAVSGSVFVAQAIFSQTTFNSV